MYCVAFLIKKENYYMVKTKKEQKKVIILSVCILSVFNAFAQEHIKSKDSTHEKEPSLELVLSGVSIYNTEHKTSDLATDVHLTYWASHKWAFGIGYTFVFEEDNRVGHEIAALVSHKPWSFLTVNTGPSFALPNSHKDTVVSGYLEGEFAFKLRDFHLGPTIGALMGKEFKVFMGWHFSYEF